MRRLTEPITIPITAAASVSANATPVLPNLNYQSGANIVQVAQGCGGGFHRNGRGFCVPNYRPYAYAPAYRAYNYPYYRGRFSIGERHPGAAES